MIKAYINGREVTNPAAKALILAAALAVVAVALSLVVFVVLPLIGVVVGVALGIAAVSLITIPVALLMDAARSVSARARHSGVSTKTRKRMIEGRMCAQYHAKHL